MSKRVNSWPFVCQAEFLLTFMWRGACRGWNQWRRQWQWRGWMKQPFCSGLKFTDKASYLSDLPGPRKNRGNRRYNLPVYLNTCRWGNSIQGDFRCGCRFILEHIKECHQHVYASSGLSIVILQVPHCHWGAFWFDKNRNTDGEGVSQDAADCIKEDKNDFFVVRKDM